MRSNGKVFTEYQCSSAVQCSAVQCSALPTLLNWASSGLYLLMSDFIIWLSISLSNSSTKTVRLLNFGAFAVLQHPPTLIFRRCKYGRVKYNTFVLWQSIWVKVGIYFVIDTAPLPSPDLLLTRQLAKFPISTLQQQEKHYLKFSTKQVSLFSNTQLVS